MITREQVISLAAHMPLDKLASWYEYGLFILAHPTLIPAADDSGVDEVELQAEWKAWEAASDEDWLKLEHQIAEAA
jgi:hypothetical protein